MSNVRDQAWLDRGYAMADAVYGPGAGKVMAAANRGPFMEETAGHLFGEIWSRPHLSIRDRRMLVLGATFALGRKDLVEIQACGALINGELDEDALGEAALQLAFYVGWGNAGAAWQGIVSALKAHAAGLPQTMGTQDNV